MSEKAPNEIERDNNVEEYKDKYVYFDKNGLPHVFESTAQMMQYRQDESDPSNKQ